MPKGKDNKLSFESSSLNFEEIIPKLTEATLQKVNLAWLKKESALILSLVEPITSYRSYLESTRKEKASKKDLPKKAEIELLRQATQAHVDLRSLCASYLKVMRHIDNVSLFDAAINDIAPLLDKNKSLQLDTILNEVLAIPGVVSEVATLGVSESTLIEMGKLIASFKATLQKQGNRLAINIPERDKIVFLESSSKSPNNQDIEDLLFSGLMDEAIDKLISSGGSLPVNIIPPIKPFKEKNRIITPLEAALISSLTALSGMTGHVRKLEDAGLPSYEGADPGTVAAIILIVVGAIMIGLGIAFGALCRDGKGEEFCVLNVIFLIIGFAVVGVGSCLIEGCEASATIGVGIGGATFGGAGGVIFAGFKW